MVRAALYPRASQLFIPHESVFGGIFCRRPVRAALCPAPVEAVPFQSVLPPRTTHSLPPLWLQTLYPAGRSLWRAALGAAAPPRGGPAPGPARPGPAAAPRVWGPVKPLGRSRGGSELRGSCGGGAGAGWGIPVPSAPGAAGAAGPCAPRVCAPHRARRAAGGAGAALGPPPLRNQELQVQFVTWFVCLFVFSFCFL